MEGFMMVSVVCTCRMAQSQRDVFPVAAQTMLAEPIKIRLHQETDARHRLMRQARILRDDGQDPEEWAAFRAVGTDRQKTNIVVKTREEARSLVRLLGHALPKTQNEQDAISRVKDELETGLIKLGFEVEGDKYDVSLREVEGAYGEAPPSPPYEPGVIVNLKGKHIGVMTGSGEPYEELLAVEVVRLGPSKVLVERAYPSSSSYTWVSPAVIEGVNDEELERRERRVSIKEKRRQVDEDALAALVTEHLKQEAARVWPSGTVPVEDIDIVFSNRLSYHGGFYYPRAHREYENPTIKLAMERYVNRGLNCLLEIARHELIHAWQDFHPDGNPADTHKHHGRDFKQWVEPMNTH